MRCRLPHADVPRRWLAAGLAGVVFALTLLAASPIAHDRLHGSSVSRADDQCAVVLFANGVSLAVGAIQVVAPIAAWQAVVAAPPTEIFLCSPRYLRQPERGPPVLG